MSTISPETVQQTPSSARGLPTPNRAPMPLYVATHQHSPNSCPASPDAAPELLNRISAANAARCGVTILAEAILDNRHHLLLILQAPHRTAIEQLLGFLTTYGTLEIFSASSSETAIARGGCQTNARRNTPTPIAQRQADANAVSRSPTPRE